MCEEWFFFSKFYFHEQFRPIVFFLYTSYLFRIKINYLFLLLGKVFKYLKSDRDGRRPFIGIWGRPCVALASGVGGAVEVGYTWLL